MRNTSLTSRSLNQRPRDFAPGAASRLTTHAHDAGANARFQLRNPKSPPSPRNSLPVARTTPRLRDTSEAKSTLPGARFQSFPLLLDLQVDKDQQWLETRSARHPDRQRAAPVNAPRADGAKHNCARHRAETHRRNHAPDRTPAQIGRAS